MNLRLSKSRIEIELEKKRFYPWLRFVNEKRKGLSFFNIRLTIIPMITYTIKIAYWRGG
jgi:hypothetical protein